MSRHADLGSGTAVRLIFWLMPRYSPIDAGVPL